MGRKLEFDRNQALEQAMESFWVQGYDSTSMRELARGLGLNLGSVYNSLGNKEQVFEAAMQLHFENTLRPRFESLRNCENALGGIEALLEFLAKECNSERGCFYMNSLADINRINESISKALRSHLNFIESSIRDCLLTAQQQGSLSSEKDIQLCTSLILSCLFSMRAMIILGFPIEHVYDVSRMVIKTLKN